MPKLTASEKRLIRKLVSDTVSVMEPRSRRNPIGPDRATIYPKDAAELIVVNAFIARGLVMLARKLTGNDRKFMVFRASKVREINGRIRKKLMVPKPISSLVITGDDAILYFGALNRAHEEFGAIRKNYIEGARDIKRAEGEAKLAWWALRSLIQVGHMPVEKSRFIR